MGAPARVLQPAALSLGSPKLLSDVLHLAETHNPDVIASEYAVEEADAEVRLNRGNLLPEVDLIGNSTRSYGENVTLPGREDSSQLLVQVTVPLYRSGTDYSKTRAAKQVVLSVGKREEAKAMLVCANFAGDTIFPQDAITLFNAELWPEQDANWSAIKSSSLFQTLEFVRTHRGADALAMFSAPDAGDVIRSADSVLSAAIEAGERDIAFAILEIASAKAYRDIHTEPRFTFLQAMAEAAKRKQDAATLKRIVDELKPQAEQISSMGYRDYDVSQKLVAILKVFIAAGETDFATRLADKSGQNKYEVYLALTKSYLQSKRRREAHVQIVRAWRSIQLGSGYGDASDGPIDQIAALLLQTGDLRGARFVGGDYGMDPSSPAKLAKQMTVYCAILEPSIESPRARE